MWNHKNIPLRIYEHIACSKNIKGLTNLPFDYLTSSLYSWAGDTTQSVFSGSPARALRPLWGLSWTTSSHLTDKHTASGGCMQGTMVLIKVREFSVRMLLENHLRLCSRLSFGAALALPDLWLQSAAELWHFWVKQNKVGFWLNYKAKLEPNLQQNSLPADVGVKQSVFQ